MKTMHLLVALLVLTGFYFLFATEVSGSEAIAALPAVAVALGVVVVMQRCAERRYILAAPWLRLIAIPGAALISDAVRVGKVLITVILHRPANAVGVFSRQPFCEG